jgi:hypothetical protein
MKQMNVKRQESQLKTYQIPVTWLMNSVIDIEAHSLEEAIKLAYEQPLPPGEYIDGSFEVDETLVSMWYPEEQ